MPGLKLLFLITLTVSPNTFDIDILIAFWLGTLNFIFTFELNGFGYAGNKKISSGNIGSGPSDKNSITLFTKPGVPFPKENDHDPAISFGNSGDNNSSVGPFPSGSVGQGSESSYST